ncbi:hypothetical protein BaRGS_00016292 [Batillaria attramentaria]|uniref:Uncharacterized protein n=1 Tax=Batillaria attramentaria TaxID=370345 RepID=A0ABD0KYX4_9CAEN
MTYFRWRSRRTVSRRRSYRQASSETSRACVTRLAGDGLVEHGPAISPGLYEHKSVWILTHGCHNSPFSHQVITPCALSPRGKKRRPQGALHDHHTRRKREEIQIAAWQGRKP